MWCLAVTLTKLLALSERARDAHPDDAFATFMPLVLKVAIAAEEYAMARDPIPEHRHAVSEAVLAMRAVMRPWESA